MKQAIFLGLWVLATPFAAQAQDSIYRCGNEYTNNAIDAKARGCKLVQGGNITVIAAPKTAANPGVKVAAVNSNAPGYPPRVDPADQRSRDSDARAILEGELRRTQARQADLQKEYNNGEPEKQGLETRNHQKYLDRVADLKAGITRNEEDIAGIRRELGRLSNGPTATR